MWTPKVRCKTRLKQQYEPEPSLFRTTFLWPTNWPRSLQLRFATIYDDGLVLYLNGMEIWRTNMASAPVTAQTRAISAAASCNTNLSLTVTNLLPGTNWLAAAAVQSVIVFGSFSVFGVERILGTAPFAITLPEASPPMLNVTSRGTNAVRLSWTGPGYALESATNLNLGSASYPLGPWQEVPNMSNPYTNSLAGPARFFRLKK